MNKYKYIIHCIIITKILLSKESKKFERDNNRQFLEHLPSQITVRDTDPSVQQLSGHYYIFYQSHVTNSSYQCCGQTDRYTRISPRQVHFNDTSIPQLLMRTSIRLNTRSVYR